MGRGDFSLRYRVEKYASAICRSVETSRTRCDHMKDSTNNGRAFYFYDLHWVDFFPADGRVCDGTCHVRWSTVTEVFASAELAPGEKDMSLLRYVTEPKIDELLSKLKEKCHKHRRALFGWDKRSRDFNRFFYTQRRDVRWTMEQVNAITVRTRIVP